MHAAHVGDISLKLLNLLSHWITVRIVQPNNKRITMADSQNIPTDDDIQSMPKRLWPNDDPASPEIPVRWSKEGVVQYFFIGGGVAIRRGGGK